MSKLSKEEIEFITKCLNEGKALPDNYRYIIPFETKKEYELTYEGKKREEDILADTMAVPLQPVKTFGNNGNGWTNKLILGDNLQVFKALMDSPEVYDKNTGRGKVKLIYIDPPFGTGDIYDAKRTAPAYSAKLQGSKFIEFLRKHIVFLKEILAEMEVLKIYLQRWSIECIFKEIRQYFGYDQSKSSNYAAMIADLTIRYVFYTMFCYRKEENSYKPMGRIVAQFYQELFDMWLNKFVEIMFIQYAKDFVDYAIELGYSNLYDLRKNIDKLLQEFFEREVFLDKITEADNHSLRKSA